MPSLDLSQLGDALGSRQLLTLEPGAVPLSAAWVPRRSHSRRTPTVQLQQSQHLQERVLLQQQLPLAQPLTSRPLPTEATSSRDLAQLDSPQAASGLNSSSLHEHPTVPDLLELEFLEGSFACSTSSGPSDKQQRKNSNFQVNFGRAIRALREDIPSFFKREGDMSIYAPDMRFQDNISARLWSRKFDLRGVSEYQRHCQRMRTIFSFLFKHSDVSSSLHEDLTWRNEKQFMSICTSLEHQEEFLRHESEYQGLH